MDNYNEEQWRQAMQAESRATPVSQRYQQLRNQLEEHLGTDV